MPIGMGAGIVSESLGTIRSDDILKGTATITFEDGQQIHEIECPLCHKLHRLDDPQEEEGISIYCDTNHKRVPFPGSLKSALVQIGGSVEDAVKKSADA